MKFYDTSSLLIALEDAFTEPFVISNITFSEIEKIKNDNRKDTQVKFNARKLSHLLEDHDGEYQVITFTKDMLEPLFPESQYEINNDIRILACATTMKVEDEPVFITNDLNLRNLARQCEFMDVRKAEPPKDDYKGFMELWATDDQLNDIALDSNTIDALVGEYVIVHSIDDAPGDKPREIVCWTGDRFRRISYSSFDSSFMGHVEPMKGDIYQRLASDSFLHNQISLIGGSAGTGKSYLSLGYLFSQLDQKRIDKIVIFCNPVPSKDAAELGFYKGDRIEKLLDSSVGRILSDKLIGGRDMLESLINMGKIDLVPLVDARGCDLSYYDNGEQGKNRRPKVAAYVMEAQNTTIELMRLIIQRLGDDTQLIVDGDVLAQTDLAAYENGANGVRRASKVFRGTEIFGQVELQIVHRSRAAEIAERM